MPFSPEAKTQMFIRCDRLCCLCLKRCGSNIEAAHIRDEHEGGSNEEENGIPVCLDCHQEIGAYNTKHPKGNKFRSEELRARRNRVYKLVESGQIHALFASKDNLGQNNQLGNDAPRSARGRTSENAAIPGKNGERKPLSELEFNILVVVGKGKRVTARDVALAVLVSEEKAKFHLDELDRKHGLVDWYGNMNRGESDHYMLTHAGRGLLVERQVF
jgi:hypothetical protein